MPDVIAARLDDPSVLLAGNAAERLASFLAARGVAAVPAPGDGNPDAVAVAEIGAARLADPGAAGRTPVAPLYLHAPAAVKPAHGGRLRP